MELSVRWMGMRTVQLAAEPQGWQNTEETHSQEGGGPTLNGEVARTDLTLVGLSTGYWRIERKGFEKA